MRDELPPRPKQESIRTSIWQEQASADNPFIPGKILCCGYDVAELRNRCSWTEFLFLLLRGELPTPEEHRLLNILMVSVANPGPRDPAVRAAMNCGVGKTPVATILAAGVTVHGGMAGGALEVEYAMRFLRGELRVGPAEDGVSVGRDLLHGYECFISGGDARMVVPLPEDPPGFGLWYGDPDPRGHELLDRLRAAGGEKEACHRTREIERALIDTGRDARLNFQGAFAAGCCDLALPPEKGAGLYLVAGSAGILAHGVEQLPRSWNEYPFWADPKYFEYVGPVPEDREQDFP